MSLLLFAVVQFACGDSAETQPDCEAGDVVACYSGPDGTAGVGRCFEGTRTCLADRSGYSSSCEGETVPVLEDCATLFDDDCDGEVNEGCACEPGSTASCYSGPPTTPGVGTCRAGTQTCESDGQTFGPCTDEVVPLAEDCATPEDDDCDETANEEDAGCVCAPGDSESCYSGPDGTLGVGICTAGTQACDSDGKGWGSCEGQVLPAPEDCAAEFDENCDGEVNEASAGCSCEPGMTSACYSGPVGTLGVGICVGGAQTCLPSGIGYGPCLGEVPPQPETCTTPHDDDCDGSVNEEGAGCVCVPGSIENCYSGPAATLDLGLCQGGTHTCEVDGLGYGPCIGEVVPSPETCTTPDDDDCDGFVNEEGAECVCVPGSIENCYSGPAGTLDVGLCQGGTHTCEVDGLGYGPCAGEVVPTAETCNTPGDDDCDGLANEDGAGCVCQPNASGPCYTGPPGTLGVGVCVAGSSTCNAGGTALGPCIGQVVPTVDNCNTPADENCDGANAICNSDYWSDRFGDADYQDARGVATDAAGNVIFTGFFKGAMDVGGGALTSAGDYDAYLAKLDSTGSFVFAKRFGDAAAQQSHAVATDSAGNIYLVGRFRGAIDFGGGLLTSAGLTDIFLAKFDMSGNHLWSARFGDAGFQDALLVTVDAAENVIVAGTMEGTTDLGGGPLGPGVSNIFVAKFDSQGAHLSSKRFGNPSSGQYVPTGLTTVPTGEVVLSGFFSNSIDFGGGLLTCAPAGFDGFIVALDGNLEQVWVTQVGASGTHYVNGVSADPFGNVALVGQCFADVDIGGNVVACTGGVLFAAQLGTSGDFQWAHVYGTGESFWNRVSQNSVGDVILAGSFNNTVDFGLGPLVSAGFSDTFLVKLDVNGTTYQAQRFGDGGGSQNALGVVVDGNDDILLVGGFGTTLDFGYGLMTSGGGQDAWVAKLPP